MRERERLDDPKQYLNWIEVRGPDGLFVWEVYVLVVSLLCQRRTDKVLFINLIHSFLLIKDLLNYK